MLLNINKSIIYYICGKLKNNKMKKIFIVLAVMFVVFTTQTNAQKVINKIIKQKVLVVGTTGEQFPFTFKNDKGELEGIDIRIANRLATELGVEVKFEIMPFEKLIESLETEKIDIILSGMSATPKRNTKIAFPGVYYKTGKSILTFKKDLYKGKAETVNSDKITLVATENTTSEKYVKAHYPKAKLVTVKDIDEAKKMLINGKVDGVVADYETIEMLAFGITDKSVYYQNISAANEKEFISPAVSPKDFLFINLVSNFIDRVNAFDEDEAIENLWIQYLN